MRNGRMVLITGLFAVTVAAIVMVTLVVGDEGSKPSSQSRTVHYRYEGIDPDNADQREELEWTYLKNKGTIKGSYTVEVKSDAGVWEKQQPAEFSGTQHGNTITIPGSFIPNLNEDQVVGTIGSDGTLRLNIALGIETYVLHVVSLGR